MGGALASQGVGGSGATGAVPYSADVGAPNTSLAYAGGGAVPVGNTVPSGGGNFNWAQFFQQMGRSGAGGSAGGKSGPDPMVVPQVSSWVPFAAAMQPQAQQADPAQALLALFAQLGLGGRHG